MSISNELKQYNQEIFTQLRANYKHFQVGFFNSDNILFIGQNPGRAFSLNDMLNIEKYSLIENHGDFETEYFEQWRSSNFGQVLEKIINKHWELVSFTNFVKIPTVFNKEPTLAEIALFFPILIKQITLLKPQRIICLGKWVGKQFGIYSPVTQGIFLETQIDVFPHPSWLLRQEKERQDIEISIMNENIFSYPYNL